ncbi:hypothetical protein ACOSB0_00380, partial [Candidatus Phytoplasma citri]
ETLEVCLKFNTLITIKDEWKEEKEERKREREREREERRERRKMKGVKQLWRKGENSIHAREHKIE